MKKLLQDLARLPRFRLIDRKYGLGECRSFRVRWRKESFVPGGYGAGGFIVEFGEKKTFDRWANSTNFSVHLHYERGLYRDDVVAAHLWMEQVCRSGLFDFNGYFATIDCPRMGYFKNK
jgi:hypothetical protein